MPADCACTCVCVCLSVCIRLDIHKAVLWQVIVSETATIARTMGQTFAMPDEVVNKTMRMHWLQITNCTTTTKRTATTKPTANCSFRLDP